MYKNKEEMATAGKTNPTKGTKIDGKEEEINAAGETSPTKGAKIDGK